MIGDVLLAVLGVALVAAAAWWVVKAWKVPGRRLTQRWNSATGGVLVAMVGGGFLLIYSQTGPLVTLWAYASFIVMGGAIVVYVMTYAADRIGLAKTRLRDAELGIVYVPPAASFWGPAIALALLCSLALAALAVPWTAIALTTPGTASTVVGAGVVTSIFVSGAIGCALGFALAGIRVLLRARRIRELHLVSLCVESQVRASYETGYSRGQTEVGNNS